MESIHSLKSIIATILMCTEAIHADGLSKDRLELGLSIIKRNADTALKLIDEIAGN